ncbi:uncharacterized protein MELLADRAFT_79844 [Melampsora larici-populina 98AG31]|uniref:Uncharacterized protein n=1 Tax=Melampsora larici-populina (strain 98AG31 / pathotype 3-4-7) TaxID=747676 RepID=F4SDI3_MELLP|nr:uncharacterized protein MELLADRAFT_79844 [Melampsora larici-populina 98AG31]EGF97297.1 hypothetical protein MELLADRAFT_79844 [Melampsora larici-populina 98AG31]
MPLKRPIEANSQVTPDPKKTKLDSSTGHSQDEQVPQSVQEPAPTGLWMMAQSPLFGLTSALIEANKLVTQDVPQVYRAAINLLFWRKQGINLPAKPPVQEAEAFGVKNKLSVTKWLAKNPNSLLVRSAGEAPWHRPNIFNFTLPDYELATTMDATAQTSYMHKILGLFYSPGAQRINQAVRMIVAAVTFARMDTNELPVDYTLPEVQFPNQNIGQCLQAAHHFKSLHETKQQTQTVAECMGVMAGMVNRLYTVFEAVASLRAKFHHALHLSQTPADRHNQLLSEYEAMTKTLGTGSIPSHVLGPLVAFLVSGVKGLMIFPHDKGRYGPVKLSYFLVLVNKMHGQAPIEEPIRKYTQNFTTQQNISPPQSIKITRIPITSNITTQAPNSPPNSVISPPVRTKSPAYQLVALYRNFTTQTLESSSLTKVLPLHSRKSLVQFSTLTTTSIPSNIVHPTMEASPTKEEYFFSVPDILEIQDLDRREMDKYVNVFPATQHGYRMRVGHSNDGSHLCHYECYRSGHPSGGIKTSGTRSLRIGCPFKISARFLPEKECWLLIHTHLGHNHPADLNVKPRKKTLAKDPILPYPHNLSLKQTKDKDDDTDCTKSKSPLTEHQHLTEPLQDSRMTSSKTGVIDSALTRLAARLHSLTPRRCQEAILMIEQIITNDTLSQSSSSHQEDSHEGPPNAEASKQIPNIVNMMINITSPDSFTPDCNLPELDDMRNLILNSKSSSSPPPLDQQQLFLDKLMMQNNFEDLYPNDLTNSSFNLDDLICAPKDATHCDTPVAGSPGAIVEAPLEAATDTPQPPIVDDDHTVNPPCNLPDSMTTAPTTILTRKRARDQALAHLDLLNKYSIHSLLRPFVTEICESRIQIGTVGFGQLPISLGRPAGRLGLRSPAFGGDH